MSPVPLTPRQLDRFRAAVEGQWEPLSVARYRAAIEEQRRLGLAAITATADRVRAELGLRDPEPAPYAAFLAGVAHMSDEELEQIVDTSPLRLCGHHPDRDDLEAAAAFELFCRQGTPGGPR